MLLCTLIAALWLAAFSSELAAQSRVDELEPNDPCVAAQDFGILPVPFFVPGSLDSTEAMPDVGFYRFSGTAGQLLTVTLEGSANGMGSLPDPFLGYFDADCQLQAFSDDDAGTLNSRLHIVLPEDGDCVLGATQCCDRFVNAMATDADGAFLFTTDHQNFPLAPGTYALTLEAYNHPQATGEPFEVLEGEGANLGDQFLTAIELIGTISGRLVDGLRETPLPGNSAPFALVQLERCEEWGCYPVIGHVYADENGNFQADGASQRLLTGAFRIKALAGDYYPFVSEPFYLGNREDADLGDIALTPFPIAFGDVIGCEVIQPGGACDFDVAITNRGRGRYRGEVWSIVEYLSLEYPYRSNRFQIGRAGAENPNPISVNLTENRQTTVRFRLQNPDNVPEGTCFWVSVNIGRMDHPIARKRAPTGTRSSRNRQDSPALTGPGSTCRRRRR